MKNYIPPFIFKRSENAKKIFDCVTGNNSNQCHAILFALSFFAFLLQTATTALLLANLNIVITYKNGIAIVGGNKRNNAKVTEAEIKLQTKK